VVLAWKPYTKGTIGRWEDNGGALLWRPHPIGKVVPPPSDAMLFVECPFQIDKFQNVIKDVKQEIVIYRPPTWELHNQTLDHMYPNRDTYVTLDAIMRGFVGRELDEEMQGVLDACGYPASTTAVFTAWDIEQLTGWTEKFLKYAMNYKYRYNSGRWHVYTLRIPPTDRDMLWAYNILLEQPEISRKVHTLRVNLPKGGRILGFETMLKRMLKEHYVTRDDNIYVINTAHPPLDYDKIDAINNMYRGRWFAMKSLVDSTEEYYL
jgi:hypothetical protein